MSDKLYAQPTSLSAFFREEVVRARGGRTTSTSLVDEYLVSLLVEQAHPPPDVAELAKKSYTLALAEVLGDPSDQRVDRLRQLGDATLFECGFFEARLVRRGVSPGYVRQLGARAYDEAAAVLRRRSGWDHATWPELFHELAGAFDELVGVLRSLARSWAAAARGALRGFGASVLGSGAPAPTALPALALSGVPIVGHPAGDLAN